MVLFQAYNKIVRKKWNFFLGCFGNGKSLWPWETWVYEPPSSRYTGVCLHLSFSAFLLFRNHEMFTEQEQWTRCPSKKPTWSFFSCYFSHRVGFISFNQWCLHLRDTSQPPLLLSRKMWKLFSFLGNIQTFFDSRWVLAGGHLEQGAAKVGAGNDHLVGEWPPHRSSLFPNPAEIWRELSHLTG